MYKDWGPFEFSRRALWVLRKNPEEGEQDILPINSRFWNRRLVPFVHNRIQRDLDDSIILLKSQRNIMLKPRQAGYTTWSIGMRLFLQAIMNPGVGCMLISQNAEYAAAHFDILKRFWRYFFVADPFDSGNPNNEWANSLRQNLLHVVYSNRRELVFDQLDSRVRCASAEVEEVGQGLTLQCLVCTELSRWEGNPEETMANVKEAIPEDGTLDIECTPNGAGGYFFEEWNRASNPLNPKREFKPHFHTWWWHDEYTRTPPVPVTDMTEEERDLVMANKIDGKRLTGGQIQWRRVKKESLRHNFMEKYPEDSQTCVAANTPITLANGLRRTIIEIFNSRYGGKVLSVDSDGKIVARKVVGWHCTRRGDRRLYRLECAHARMGGRSKKRGTTLTEEHLVLTQDGWKRVDSADGLQVATGTLEPKGRALQVVLGTLLGDGHVSPHYTFSCTQIKEEYVRMKARVLRDFDATVSEGICKAGYANKPIATFTVRMKSLPYFGFLRDSFYSNGSRYKMPPVWACEKLTNFGIAIWFMDDGWTNHHASSPYAGISLGVVPMSIGTELAEVLTKKGFECSCKRSSLYKNGKRYQFIRFTKEGSRALYQAIGKFVPACMRYKLPKGNPRFERKWYKRECGNTVFFDKASIKPVFPVRNRGNGKWDKQPVYCIDVEGTHNFITPGGVAHNCFLVSGNMFFERGTLNERYRELLSYEPPETFNKFVIFKTAVKHRRYIIAADPATGMTVTSEDPDYSAAVVIDLETGEEMVSYRAHVLPGIFGDDLVQLARLYNNAEIAVERLGEGGTVIEAITKQNLYGNIYWHKDWWRRDASNSKAVKEFPGFPTNPRNRPMALNRLKEFLSTCPDMIYSKDFIAEALTFCYNEKGKPEAIKGSHDDCVLCRGIAYYVRALRLGLLLPESIRRREKYGARPTELQEEEEKDQ